MQASTHYRDATSIYQGICGAGYYYPSTISLTTDTAEVTCHKCISILNN